MTEIITIIVLLVIGYSAGTLAEKKHFKSIKTREIFYKKIILNTSKSFSGIEEVEDSRLVAGSCVVALDYFKMFFANLINLVGGEMISYESLIDRARREAILRMKEEAKGYNFIINTRIETSSIGKSANSRHGLGAVEVMVYGTAVKIKKELNEA